MHWFTDVLTGSVIGACQGVLWVLAWHTPTKTATPPGEQIGEMTSPLIQCFRT
jgi:membrane-associated phospholipid phosphatase